MIARIKAFLDSSYVWLLALFAGIFFLWSKEKDLENQLQETKADENIKGDKVEQQEVDSTGADALADYERTKSEYLKSSGKSPDVQ